MSINETQYKFDIEALQSAVAMIASTPGARLEIEQHRAKLTISGEYASYVRGVEEIAKVLDRTGDRFFDTLNDDPVEPVLDMNDKVARSRPFVVITQADSESTQFVHPMTLRDFITDAAYGHQVSQDVVEAVVAPYQRDDCFTIVFDLDGEAPYVLHNSAKPQEKDHNGT